MNKILSQFFLVLLAIYFLSGCSFIPLSEEKQEEATLNAFSTVFAEMTTQAYLNPTSTELPQATSSSTPAASPTHPETSTLAPTSTFTPSPTSPTLKAQLMYVTTYPEYKFEFTPNEKFGVAIGFTNTGSVTWGSGSKLVLVGYDGEYVTVQTEAILERPVAPGEKVEFNLWAFGSEDMSYQSNYFQLYSEFGVPVDGGYAVFSYQPI
jgi:hypothetical protein